MVSRPDLAALIEAVPFAPGLPLGVAVAERNGRITELVQGHWSDGSAVKLTDPFYAASLAKQVTGAGVAVLIDRGHLDPADRLVQFLPGMPAWMHDLTLLQLLGHRAGFPAAGVLENRLQGAWTTADVIAALRNMPAPADPPGRRFSYSNAGYVILARIIEQISGQDFASFVQGELFEPLELTGIGFPRGDVVATFRQTAGMGPTLPLSHGDGGLWTTARAFVQWLVHQNRDTLEVAHRVETSEPTSDGAAGDYGWGIGLRSYRGEPLFIHGGSWPGACCKAVRSRAFGVSIAVFAASQAEQDHVGMLVDSILAASA